MKITSPALNESAPFYRRYINLVPEGDLMSVLKNQSEDTLVALDAIPNTKWDHSYMEGKWSIKELLCHLIDTERIFAYRALRIARADQTPLAGFEQDDYIPFSDASGRSGRSFIDEYQCVRNATISLFAHLTEEALLRMGTASESPISVRACGYIIAGHELHHMQVMRERYL